MLRAKRDTPLQFFSFSVKTSPFYSFMKVVAVNVRVTSCHSIDGLITCVFLGGAVIFLRKSMFLLMVEIEKETE